MAFFIPVLCFLLKVLPLMAAAQGSDNKVIAIGVSGLQPGDSVVGIEGGGEGRQQFKSLLQFFSRGDGRRRQQACGLFAPVNSPGESG